MTEENENTMKTKEEQMQDLDDMEEEMIPETAIADFEEFDESLAVNPNSDSKLEYLNDLQLNVYIELGRTQMRIKDILELERGYVIELDKLASEPVDIFVNNKKIAEGEVVVIDKHFGIRIVNLVDASKRVAGLS